MGTEDDEGRGTKVWRVRMCPGGATVRVVRLVIPIN